HISKHDTGHPTPENPLSGILATVSRNIELTNDNSDKVGWLNWCAKIQPHMIGIAMSYPQLKFLAAELVQQGFIF
ncbi:MAG: hypothetical protein II953_07600, partial [Clostridia bacterium]|nr:hypothetical protein [Clostridia bacterium]